MKKKFLQNIKNHEKNNNTEIKENIINHNTSDNFQSDFDNEFNKSMMFLDNLHINNKKIKKLTKEKRIYLSILKYPTN